jgi:hypothetical protein
LGDGSVGHSLPIPDNVGIENGVGGRVVVVAQTLRTYADAGSDVTVVLATPTHGTNPDAFCFVSLSGQLIDVP